ncbi:hypothetical protein BH24ACT15_BH24ACT15_26360 [soil metagenome]
MGGASLQLVIEANRAFFRRAAAEANQKRRRQRYGPLEASFAARRESGVLAAGFSEISGPWLSRRIISPRVDEASGWLQRGARCGGWRRLRGQWALGACLVPRCFRSTARRVYGSTVLGSGRGWRCSVAWFAVHRARLAARTRAADRSALLGLVTAGRRRGRRGLGLAAVAVVGPLLVLIGGELVPHLVNPCVLPDLAGAEPPGFCVTTLEGADVPDNWHALDHAVVGFLPVSLLVAWWWRRSASRHPIGMAQR